MMEDLVLVGFGGHAKSIVDSINKQGKYNIIGYTDLEERDSKYQYLGTDDLLEDLFDQGIKNAFICIGYLGKEKIREKIYQKLKEIGFTLPVIIDPSAIISDTAVIEEGTFIGKSAVLNTEVFIGKCCIINTGAIIDHESIVNDFAHVAVGAVLCGQVNVGHGAFVGANSTVIQCITVDKYEIVPAGFIKRR